MATGLLVCFFSSVATWNIFLNLENGLGGYGPLAGSPLQACLDRYVPSAECAPNNAMFVRIVPPVFPPPNSSYGAYSYDVQNPWGIAG